MKWIPCLNMAWGYRVAIQLAFFTWLMVYEGLQGLHSNARLVNSSFTDVITKIVCTMGSLRLSSIFFEVHMCQDLLQPHLDLLESYPIKILSVEGCAPRRL
jgi:hypothetical protein